MERRDRFSKQKAQTLRSRRGGGAAAGAILGGAAGGYAGKTGGEALNPAGEDICRERSHAKQDDAMPEDKHLGADSKRLGSRSGTIAAKKRLNLKLKKS